jgi:MFS family permease
VGGSPVHHIEIGPGERMGGRVDEVLHEGEQRLAQRQGLAQGVGVRRWCVVEDAGADQPVGDVRPLVEVLDPPAPTLVQRSHEVQGEVPRDVDDTHVTILTGDGWLCKSVAVTSPTWQVTQPRSDVRRSLITYCLGALCVRMVDSGAGIGFLLLAQLRLDPPTAARTGGVLVALFTLPHLAGPLVARRLDLARDYRRLLGGAYVLMAVVLAASTVALGSVPTVFVGALIVLAGFGGPLLTGGLSSRLADLVPPDDLAQRRAQGLDATVYGVAGTAGPALVAALSGWVSPEVALFTLCGLAVVSAVLLRALPSLPARDVTVVPRAREVLPLVLLDPALRRVNYLTMATAAAQNGLAVVVVQLARPYEVRPSTTAVLLSVMGAGNLVASLVLSARPLSGDPDRLTTRHVAIVGACICLCALAPSFWFGVGAFALVGVATAPFVTATFAARNQFAPVEARAQVFVTLSSLKVTAASGGAALAGLLVGLGPTLMLVLSGSAVLLTAVASILDRRFTRAQATT